MNRYNEIASVLDGSQPFDGAEEILRRLCQDGEGIQTLAMASWVAGIRTPDLGYPFEVRGGFFAGTEEDYIRPLFLEGVRLRRSLERISTALVRIARGTLPPCFQRRVELDWEGLGHPALVTLSITGESSQLTLSPATTSPDQVEIWVEGQIRRTFSLSGKTGFPSVPIRNGEFVAIRRSDSEAGIGIYLVPMEFGHREWASGCLFAALSGDFREAIRILAAKLTEGREDGGCRGRLVSLLASLTALTKPVGYSLRPVPLTRGDASTEEERREAYAPIWRGLCECWPETAGRPNPWTVVEISQATPQEIPSEAAQLLATTVEAIRSAPEPGSLEPPTAVSNEAACGWAALRGITFLLEGNPSASARAFSTAQPSERDPFSLKSLSHLAEHLALAEKPETTEERWESSTENLWTQLFQPLVA